MIGFELYEPNVKAAISFLRTMRIQVTNESVKESLQGHPDWPSLLSISDCLQSWNIPNVAGRIDRQKLDTLPLPFMAHMLDGEDHLAVVKQISHDEVVYLSKNYKKEIKESRDIFLKKWDGIYLVAEKNDKSGEFNFFRKQLQILLRSVCGWILMLATLYVAFRHLQQKLLFYPTAHLTGGYILGLLNAIGIVLSSLLLWYEVDKGNQLLRKVCSGFAKTNCSAILESRKSKLFSWLSWSEVGFIYFFGNVLFLLFAPISLSHILSLLGWIGICSLPYTVFSVFYQWRIAKQWCILCLSVQVVLVLTSINNMYQGYLNTDNLFSGETIIVAILFYSIPALVWYLLKPYIIEYQIGKRAKSGYLRIKFNPDIFFSLLKRQKPVTHSVDGLGISLGPQAASNSLIKVCNPYCGPCSIAHPKIEKLLQNHENLSVRIIFSVPDENDEFVKQPIKHLMAISGGKNRHVINEALDDWYLADQKNYANFSKKYPIDELELEQNKNLNEMKVWCEQMSVKATPTIFFNGYQLPDEYDIEDLEYFLLE